MSRQIRAAVMYEYNTPLSVEAVELCEPADDQVLVKMVATGLCGTDASVLHGNLPYPPPLVLGHEGAGIIEAVGKNVTHLAPGDHVITSFVQHCGSCHYCLGARPHLCDRGVWDAIEGKHMRYRKDDAEIACFGGIGAFAEMAVLQGSAAFKIPEEVPLNRACLFGCSVMTGVGAAINTAKVAPGETVAVFGCGGVGLSVIQGAAIAGAGRILALDLDARRLEAASALGATETIQIDKDADASQEVLERTDNIGVDYAFEAIGIPAVMTQAFLSTKRGGKAIIVGVAGFGQEVSIPASILALDERALCGSLYGSAVLTRDVPRLLGLYQGGKLKLDEMVTREYPLESVNEAFAAMQSGEAVRPVIRFD